MARVTLFFCDDCGEQKLAEEMHRVAVWTAGNSRGILTPANQPAPDFCMDYCESCVKDLRQNASVVEKHFAKPPKKFEPLKPRPPEEADY